MDTLLRGLRNSRYAILREVVENDFPMKCGRESVNLVLKLLRLSQRVLVYDLSDGDFHPVFRLRPALHGADGGNRLYLDEYGV